MKLLNFSKSTLLLAAGIAFLLTSCSKYDDGPFLSLKTKTSRLTGEWNVTEINGDNLNEFFEDMFVGDSYEYYENNEDYEVTVTFDGSPEMTMEFEKGGDMTMETKGGLTVTVIYTDPWADEYSDYSDTSEYEYDLDMKATGEWEWGTDKESVEVDFKRVTIDGESYSAREAGIEDDEFDIERLTNSELWVENEDGDEFKAEKI